MCKGGRGRLTLPQRTACPAGGSRADHRLRDDAHLRLIHSQHTLRVETLRGFEGVLDHVNCTVAPFAALLYPRSRASPRHY